MGILSVNVIASTTTGGIIRATNNDNPFDLAGILTDVIGAYVGDKAAGKGNSRQMINVIRGVMSGPAGTIASSGTQMSIDVVKDGIKVVKEKAYEVFVEIDKQIRFMYGIN
jgi:hypothetical protein